VNPSLAVGLLALAVLLSGLLVSVPAWATARAAMRFENEDIQTVIAHVSAFTGFTFMYDPDHVKGKITLLSPDDVSPARALELLRSALALHGYILLGREDTWIVAAAPVALPVSPPAREATATRVVPLTYARAVELAYTLSWVAPPLVRIVPYLPTNSLVISGPAAAVEALIDIIK
jgi:general secretion pathway protein D